MTGGMGGRSYCRMEAGAGRVEPARPGDGGDGQGDSLALVTLAAFCQLLMAIAWSAVVRPLEKLMLTVPNLRHKLDLLDEHIQAAADAPQVTMPNLEVTCMDVEQLEIHIKGARSEPEQEVSSPESIEVVHDIHTPGLHGILKQRSRTLSESSDDMVRGGRPCFTTMTSEESSLHESDEDSESGSSPRERKKSVSFCEHIDKTTFKTNTSVNTMKAALKGKKRRQRKRDIKQQERQQRTERRRRSSSGSYSEHSSDEQGSSDPHNNGSEVENDAKVKGVFDVTGNAGGECDERTRGESEGSLGQVSQGDHSVVESENSVPNVVSLAPEGSNAPPNGGSDPDATADHEREGLGSEADAEDYDEDDTEEPVVKGTPSKDKYAPETMLSWQDKSPLDTQHTTKCGIEFSNSVMFDLDVD